LCSWEGLSFYAFLLFVTAETRHEKASSLVYIKYCQYVSGVWNLVLRFFFSLAFFFSGGLFFFPVPLDFSSFVQLVYSIQKKNGAERELEGRAGNELIARGLEHPSRV